MALARFEAPPSVADAIARALSMYSTVAGLQNASKDQELKQSAERRAQQGFDDSQKGVLSGKDLFEHAKDYKFSDVQDPGAIAVQVRSPEGLATKYATPKASNELTKTALTQEQFLNQLREGGKEVKSGTKGAQDITVIGIDGRPRLTALIPGQKPDMQPKAEQVNAAMFGKKALQAEDVFNKLGDAGYSRADASSGLKSLLPGVVQNEQTKAQQQAERNFVTAILRRESGAAISKSEFDSAEQQYFPRSGDTPENVSIKRANRQQAIEGLKAGAGPAWAAVKTVPVTADLSIKRKAPSDSVQSAQAGAIPKVGYVKAGYEFQGGDPSKQANWRKVQ